VATAQDIGAQDIGAQDIGAQDIGAQDIGAQDIGAQDGGAQDGGAQDGGEGVGEALACSESSDADANRAAVRKFVDAAPRSTSVVDNGKQSELSVAMAATCATRDARIDSPRQTCDRV
jgi:hypothetical protein